MVEQAPGAIGCGHGAWWPGAGMPGIECGIEPPGIDGIEDMDAGSQTQDAPVVSAAPCASTRAATTAIRNTLRLRMVANLRSRRRQTQSGIPGRRVGRFRTATDGLRPRGESGQSARLRLGISDE